MRFIVIVLLLFFAGCAINNDNDAEENRILFQSK
jgi:hypothetical protein